MSADTPPTTTDRRLDSVAPERASPAADTSVGETTTVVERPHLLLAPGGGGPHLAPVAVGVASPTPAALGTTSATTTGTPTATPSETPPATRPGSARRSWRARLRRLTVRQALESWTGSLLLHGLLLFVLAMLSLSLPRQVIPTQIVEVLDRPEELLNERLETDITPSTNLALATQGGEIGVATHGDPLTAAAEPALDERTVESLERPQVRLADVSLRSMEDERLVNDLGMESPGDPSAVVDGYNAAMNRITQELLIMLAKGPALVVWLFDQSESMQNDQEEIKSQLAEIYQELKLTSADDGNQLLTSVTSFGKEVATHTRRPTNDLDTIRAAIDEVPVDDTGIEATSRAVIEVVRSHQKLAVQGRRQLALILVTDESGDDPEGIEEAIAAAREARCRVYVLGREAVFGYPYVHIIWRDPKTQYEYWIPIRRGPETPFPELLQTDGLWRRRDAFPSGFGPYEQVRLARQTGGVFYLLPSLESNVLNGEQRLYAIEAMRPYLPDLDSREHYDTELRASPLRLALREIIEILNPWSEPQVNLAEYYPLDGEGFAQLAAGEQEKCQAYVRFLQAAEKRLDDLRARRNEEPLPRWQANYDLMLAQSVAYQVRAYEYAAAVQAFLKNPKRPKDPKINHWRVNPVPAGITAAETQEAVDRAKRLLANVLEFHPGTPYAGRAQWELDRGFGCEFVEHYHPPDYDQVKRPNF